MILKTTSRVARWGRLLFLPSSGCSRSHLSDRKNDFMALSKSCAWAGLLYFLVVPASFALQLNADSDVATAGYYQLSWKSQQKNIQLQESATADFSSPKVIYSGPDRARVVSGKPDGDYFYRVAEENNTHPVFSNTVKVTVHHHPLKTAIMFFIAGLIVFIATFTLIISGIRREA